MVNGSLDEQAAVFVFCSVKAKNESCERSVFLLDFSRMVFFKAALNRLLSIN